MTLNSAVSQSSNSSWFSRGSSDSKSTSGGRSHTYWKLFRKEVLAPHHIRILESIPAENIPEAIVTWLEANRTNTERFQNQKKAFRKQVAHGRGFGSSALFPQEVLPSNDARPFLAQCMVPTLSADALPERMIGKASNAIQKTSLSVPRPGMGYGFSAAAFASEEISCMPNHLLATGTTIHFNTGSITSGAALYCPFLTYERLFSQNDHAMEIAANQCAIDGAWSVRALQMLYAKAADEDLVAAESFLSPISFTCAIDNEAAVINCHWVDHAQTYCMAPVVRFNLSRDEHFDQFLLWTEAIGQWALSHLLPEVKKAISLLTDYVVALPALKNSVQLFDSTKQQDESGLVSALKVSYDNIPWRYDHDDCSPVSSSTASWGSPMINEAIFAKFQYPLLPNPKMRRGPASVCSEGKIGRGVRFATLPSDKLAKRVAPKMPLPALPALPQVPTQLNPPSYDEGSELVLKKRVNHAMDEIKDLQSQLSQMKNELSGSTTCIQNELSGLRKTMTSVIRKESISSKTAASPVQTRIDTSSLIQSEHRLRIHRGISVVTTPTDPRARPAPWSAPSSAARKPSGLQNVLSVDTKVETVSTTTTLSNCRSTTNCIDSPITIFSPTIINVTSSAEDIGDLVRVPNRQHNIWSQVAATHMLGTLVPSTLLRVLLLGCMLDYTMMCMAGSSAPTLLQYFAHVFETTIY